MAATPASSTPNEETIPHNEDPKDPLATTPARDQPPRNESHERSAPQPNKPVAKTTVLLDVKPWDTDTPMAQLEANVRRIEKKGLVWGRSELVDIGYGVKKLRIGFVVEDEKVSVDGVCGEIEEDGEFVQSTDVVVMQKV